MSIWSSIPTAASQYYALPAMLYQPNLIKNQLIIGLLMNLRYVYLILLSENILHFLENAYSTLANWNHIQVIKIVNFYSFLLTLR